MSEEFEKIKISAKFLYDTIILGVPKT
jgi:hypothetical protein